MDREDVGVSPRGRAIFCIVKPVAFFRQVMPRPPAIKILVHRVLLCECAIVCAEAFKGPCNPLRRRHHKEARVEVGFAADRPGGDGVSDSAHVGMRRAEGGASGHRPLHFEVQVVVRDALVRELPEVKFGMEVPELIMSISNGRVSLWNVDDPHVSFSDRRARAVANDEPKLVFSPHHAAPVLQVPVAVRASAHQQRCKDDPHDCGGVWC